MRGSAGVAGAIVVAVAIAGAAGPSALAGRTVEDPGQPYTPWLETRAAGMFDSDTPQLRGLRVAYRVDAHVLLPLGFMSFDMWSRPDVGFAVVSYRDCQADAGDIMRAYELFSASRPDRAHGFDRRGFFREAERLTPGGVAWTAYFGAMTSWPEKTFSEARKAVNGPQPHTYEAIDGLSTPSETRSSLFQVATRGKVSGPGDLWSAVRPQLDLKPPRAVTTTKGSSAKPLPAMAFLGALQVSLHSAAAHRDHPLPPARTLVPFTYNGSVRQLELSAISRDASRARQYVHSGFVRNPSDVFELRYRIRNPGFEDGEFRLWAELPGGAHDDPHATPIPPLGWELQLRSYLKLVFERTS